MIVGGNFSTAGSISASRIAAFQDNDNPSLPVQLSSFFADVVNNAVNLYWSTDTEINNLRFEVERKTEHTDWITIASIDGKGNSNVKNDYFYTDLNNLYGTIYYRLKQVDLDGNFTYTNSISVNKSANYSYSLSQNYPNPFNPVTNINYTVAKDGLVKIKVYDVLGNEVCELLNQIKAAGSYTLQFNASNLPSGVYFYKLETDNFIDTKKMLLIK